MKNIARDLDKLTEFKPKTKIKDNIKLLRKLNKNEEKSNRRNER